MMITRLLSAAALLTLFAAGAGCVDGATLQKQLADKEAELTRARRESLEARAALAECREEKSDRAERTGALAPLPAALPPQPAPALPASVSPATPASTPAALEPVNPSAAPELLNEDESYRAALALINARQTAPARVALDRFVQRFPGSKLRPNVAFWRAETDFLDSQWEAARAGFLQVAENFPNHLKVADSLYKAALCSLNLGDKATGIQQLNSILQRFPQSDAAGFAKKKLAELSKKT